MCLPIIPINCAGRVADLVPDEKELPIIPINSSLIGKCGSLDWAAEMGMRGAARNCGCENYRAGACG
jgi:hypothetical protein